MEIVETAGTPHVLSHTTTRVENLTLDVLEGVGEPVEALVQSLAVGGARGLDVPVPVPHALQAQLLRQLGRLQRVGKILFVGEYKQDSISELIFTQHSCKFVSCLANTISIVRINNENQSLGVLEIMSPQWTDFVLTADIPDGEGDVFVLDGFHVEADGGNGGDDLAQLELVQHGGLAGGVQADHQDAHLLLAEQRVEQLAN